ncbi:response regulator transcription factor [Sporolactobacillus sp. CPB3-1]|uniref:Response regulator transcription factor n=1 Tax=Sporolactobacillus mangiferae TaxID=2940498 RepID=A0ABT0MBY5_9BACL|nr:response regulator transcription factor [Sporolactobacillus mangiferae]MCL1632083.1 response regulator transcription factor [Sporolactobacillus mangiferae]
MTVTINIILVDDHLLMLMGLKELLEKEQGFHVLEAFTDPVQLESYLALHPPDILVLDVRLKNTSGIEITKQLKKSNTALKIILLSGYQYDEYVEAAKSAGADAYVTKEESNARLATVIRQVYNGEKIFPNLHPEIHSETLTTRELDILKLIAKDLTTREISKELAISKRTVEYHISSIIQKLDADSRVGAVVNAIKKGLLNI